MNLKCDETCSEDRVVAEMIRGLDQSGFDELARSFSDRIRDTPQAQNDPCWHTHFVVLVKSAAD